jgi:hypothetical protein
MNKELETELASMVEAAKNAGTNAASFIAEQAPDVAEQIVRWHIVSGVISLTGGLLMAAVASGGMFHAFKKSDNETWACVAGLLGPLILSVGLILIGAGAYDILHGITAPKLVVMEYISKFIR